MNLAEGSGMRSKKDFSRYVVMAIGSCRELQYQMMLSKDLRYIALDIFERQMGDLDRIEKMLSKLLASLRST